MNFTKIGPAAIVKHIFKISFFYKMISRSLRSDSGGRNFDKFFFFKTLHPTQWLTFLCWKHLSSQRKNLKSWFQIFITKQRMLFMESYFYIQLNVAWYSKRYIEYKKLVNPLGWKNISTSALTWEQRRPMIAKDFYKLINNCMYDKQWKMLPNKLM